MRFECAPDTGFESRGGSSTTKPDDDDDDDEENSGGNGSLSLISLSEPESCRYLVVIGTPLACEHPRVAEGRSSAATLSTSPAVGLQCFLTRSQGNVVQGAN